VSHFAPHFDWPSRILLTIRLARQDAVLLHRMTTTVPALAATIKLNYLFWMVVEITDITEITENRLQGAFPSTQTVLTKSKLTLLI